MKIPLNHIFEKKKEKKPHTEETAGWKLKIVFTTPPPHHPPASHINNKQTACEFQGGSFLLASGNASARVAATDHHGGPGNGIVSATCDRERPGVGGEGSRATGLPFQKPQGRLSCHLSGRRSGTLVGSKVRAAAWVGR